MYACMHACMYACIYIYIYVSHIYMYIYIYICMYVCMLYRDPWEDPKSRSPSGFLRMTQFVVQGTVWGFYFFGSSQRSGDRYMLICRSFLGIPIKQEPLTLGFLARVPKGKPASHEEWRSSAGFRNATPVGSVPSNRTTPAAAWADGAQAHNPLPRNPGFGHPPEGRETPTLGST